MRSLAIPTSVISTTEIQHYLDNALSENTRRSYRSDLAHYTAAGGIIPGSGEMVAAYLTKFAPTLSIATLRRRLVSISKAHSMQGLNDPVRSDLVRLTMRGIRRVHGVPQQQVAAVLKDDLTLMLSHAPPNAKGARDRALLMLGFCGALRRSELVAVRVEDLCFTEQGIILTVPRSKTDQNGQGRRIGIPFGRGRICPVKSVNDWFAHTGAISGAIFRNVGKGGKIGENALSDRSVATIVKNYAAKAGLPPERYSGHSLRSGLVTSAAQQGISSWKIRAQTGHQSDTMLNRYIRDADIFANNAAALF